MLETTGQKHINKIPRDISKSSSSTRKGDYAEYYAVTWLWEQGYEVFKNCGASGYIDLIAVKNKKIKFIDVKSTRRNRCSYSNGRTNKQKKEGVVILVFNSHSKQCKFVEHRNEKT